MGKLLLIGIIGFGAQLIDGALGMAYGVRRSAASSSSPTPRRSSTRPASRRPPPSSPTPRSGWSPPSCSPARSWRCAATPSRRRP